MMRKMTTIRIDAKILKKAQELGINISKACENALKLYIQALENANKQILSNQLQNRKREGMETVGVHQVEPRAGFEPATCGLRGRCYNRA